MPETEKKCTNLMLESSDVFEGLVLEKDSEKS